jgi:transcriptional regulator with XRE-family HTH domain
MRAAPSPAKLAVFASGREQQELADELGISRSHFSRVLNGRHRPSEQLAADIAAALGTTPDALFPNRDAIPL